MRTRLFDDLWRVLAVTAIVSTLTSCTYSLRDDDVHAACSPLSFEVNLRSTALTSAQRTAIGNAVVEYGTLVGRTVQNLGTTSDTVAGWRPGDPVLIDLDWPNDAPHARLRGAPRGERPLPLGLDQAQPAHPTPAHLGDPPTRPARARPPGRPRGRRCHRRADEPRPHDRSFRYRRPDRSVPGPRGRMWHVTGAVRRSWAATSE
ncbi:MAG: hypothetical protein R2695_06920 [Acidimicrobiales bacterium]